jgi:hypothetical protein
MTAAQSLVSPDGFTNADSDTNRMRMLADMEDEGARSPCIVDDLLTLGDALKQYPERSFNTVEIMVDDEALRALAEVIDNPAISPAAGIALKSLRVQIMCAIRSGK